MLFAHNYVESFDAKGALLKRSFCQEECILYAGDIKGDLVASGTVFRSILLWRTTSPTPEILHRLEGHKGVIFDVRFMGDTLASVSDDRSMRVWNQNGE